MSECAKCKGLVMEPNVAYGYAGPICHCQRNIDAGKRPEYYRDMEMVYKPQAEKDRKDAERWRFVKEQIYYKPPGYDGCAKGRWVWDWLLVTENGEDLDAAVDAVMLATGTADARSAVK